MGVKTKVTLFKGGTKEKTLPISEVEIPDLWKVAEVIKTTGIPKASRVEMVEMILNCWHIAGALKEFIKKARIIKS